MPGLDRLYGAHSRVIPLLSSVLPLALVSGLGFDVEGFGFRVPGFGFRIEGLGFRFFGLWFMVFVSGCQGISVERSGLRL